MWNEDMPEPPTSPRVNRMVMWGAAVFGIAFVLSQIAIAFVVPS